MIHGRILLEITENSANIQVHGEYGWLMALLVNAAESNSEFEKLLGDALDYISKQRVNEATSDLPKV